MSVDRMVVLECDADGCTAVLQAPSRLLEERARQAGWQYGVIAALYTSDDGPEVDLTDQCPDHRIEAVGDAQALEVAGGPGGLTPRVLADLRRRRAR